MHRVVIIGSRFAGLFARAGAVLAVLLPALWWKRERQHSEKDDRAGVLRAAAVE